MSGKRYTGKSNMYISNIEYAKKLEELNELRKLKNLSAANMNDYTILLNKICLQCNRGKSTVRRDLNAIYDERNKKENENALKTIRQTIGPRFGNDSGEVIRIYKLLRTNGLTRVKSAALITKWADKKFTVWFLEKMKNTVPDEITKPNENNKAKEFFRNFLNLGLIPPNEGISLHYNDTKFTVTKQDAEDICMILANAYNRFAFAQEKGICLERNVLRRAMIQHLIDDAVDTYKQNPALTNLHKLILSFDRITKTFEAVVPNLAILTAVCKDIKPTISTDEIYVPIEKYEYLENTEVE